MPPKKRPTPDRYNPDGPIKPLPKTNYSKRYEDVKATIDTGMTVPKLIEQLKNRLPTGEIFRRIRPQKLVELLSLHMNELEEKAKMSLETVKAPEETETVPSWHHMHSSIVFDDKEEKPELKRSIDCPFILLDMRDEEEFEKCHIHMAELYPKARLSRATGQFTPEILSFKGYPEKMVVMYCDYGQTSAEAAQMFAERGFDNIFLLHGGLAEFAEQFPNLVGPGEPPRPLNPPKRSTQASAASRTGTAKGTSRAARGTTAQSPGAAKKPWK